MKTTDEMEKDVLKVLANNPDDWVNHFAYEVVEACDGDVDVAMAVCKHLRAAKKVDARGRGFHAQYGHKR